MPTGFWQRSVAAALALLLVGCTVAAPPTPRATAISPTAAPITSAGSVRAAFDTSAVHQLQVGATANATFALVNDRYSIDVRQANVQVSSSFGDIVADGTVEVDLSFRAHSPPLAAGIMFRVQNDQQFYLARLSSNGYYALDARDGSTWRSLVEWTHEPMIDSRGGANRLKIVMQADLLSMYLNGVLLSQTSDTAFARGRLALTVTTYDQAAVGVDFDNLVVTPDTAGE